MRRAILGLALAGSFGLTGCGLKKTTISPGDDEPLTQWAQGVLVYGRECAGCHGEDGEGDEDSPALAPISADALGEERQRSATFATATDVFTYVKAEMPPLAPGSLSDDNYWAVTAYVLKQAQIDFEGHLTPDTASGVSLK
jgi:mono/diheme cytochrome c family protein